MFRVGAAFTAWTVFTFMCHYCAKHYVSRHPTVVSAVLLTIAQLGACFLLMRPSKESKSTSVPVSSGVGSAIALLTHACATFATNYSLALMYAPSTLTIKLLEPVMSAMVVWLVTGRPLALPTLFSLLLLLVGSLGFVGNPLASVHLGAGTCLALVSNAFYGLRNVAMKHVAGSNLELASPGENALYLASAAIAVWSTVRGNTLLTPVLLVLGSAIGHVLYSYVSTCVILKYLSVVGHAVANISKRLIVVLLMVAAGGKTLEPTRYVTGWVQAILGGWDRGVHLWSDVDRSCVRIWKKKRFG